MNLFHEDRSRSDPRRLGRLAHFIARYRWQVIGVWVVLTLFGAVAAGQLSSRWYQSLAVPGKPAYEASQRTLAALGVGVRAPNVVVFRSSGDATRSRAIERAMQRAAATMPGARTSSYFSTRSPLYLSRDRHTTFEEVYPPGPGGLDKKSGARHCLPPDRASRRRPTTTRSQSVLLSARNSGARFGGSPLPRPNETRSLA